LRLDPNHSRRRIPVRLAILVVCLAVLAPVPAAALAQDLPASGDGAGARLAESPRHGEWVKYDAGDGDSVMAWLVYPERRDRAPVVVVIHEIFGLTDWIRSVADQLAANGFIAIAPDLLSGKGPGGGGTDSFEQGTVRQAEAVGEAVHEEGAVRELGEDSSLPPRDEIAGSIGYLIHGSALKIVTDYTRGWPEGDLDAGTHQARVQLQAAF